MRRAQGVSFQEQDAVDKRGLFEQFVDLTESMPDIPWDREDSPDDDRELLGERYARESTRCEHAPSTMPER